MTRSQLLVCVSSINADDKRLFSVLGSRENEIEDDASQSRQSDTAQRECAERNDGAPNAEGKSYADDDDVARLRRALCPSELSP